ncbi:unnamed protein product [Urochloa decumbens]|uniref:non-specific serine/threonine protein kinase n=1 Tax=Urochloa decumbens TaxID=240449 RepID=A0ABC9BAI2_9POAL
MDSCTRSRDSMENVEDMKMSYELLQSITDNFSEKLLLGSGTFGKVYKGTQRNGKEIAVKVLRDMAALDEKDFKNEFQNLVKLDHQNIVQLVGYCNESENHIVEHDGRQVTAEKLHMALCFEYVDNGNLNKYISDEIQGLPWHIRYKIIKGICEGLKHLHKGLKAPVLHLDLKPHNILLDKKMVPKIADFGLSRIIGDERTRQTMNKNIGTGGYLPPEYTKFQLLSPAFDIFSLGVIITKIMVGKERYHDIADMPPRKLVNLVHNNWKKRLQAIVRPRSLEVYCHQVKACIKVASKCLMEDRRVRPKIEEIIDTLNDTEMVSIPSAIEEFEESRTSITMVGTSEGGCEASANNKLDPPVCVVEEYSYELLRKITNDFSEDRLIGQGAFGRVYKGVYEDGQVIAVKVLHDGLDDGRIYRNEIECMVNLRHEHITQLLGYCYQTKNVTLEFRGRMVLAETRQRALCLQYMPNGSLGNHISDESDGLDWCTRYKIIKGTCDGLRYLHERLPRPILHLDLNPNNILLDENMVPKIADFGGSRLFGDEHTIVTTRQKRTLRYMAPEYITIGVISTKVVRKWRTRLQETFKGRLLEGYCQQVKKCVEIALKCVEVPKKYASSLLHMFNKEDDHVAFRLLSKNPKRYHTNLPIQGIVPPRCTYTLSLTPSMKRQRPPSESDESFVLQSMAVSFHLQLKLQYLNQSSAVSEYECIFKEAQESAEDEVQELTLKSICAPPPEETSSKLTRPEIEIITTLDARKVSSIEVHPTKLWIMTTHEGGNLRIWNYQTMENLNPIEVPDEPVHVAKFIEQEDWIVAGDGNGCIHVCSCDESQDAMSFEAHNGQIVSLAVHPTEPIVLSSSNGDNLIKLWQWDQYWEFENGSWECTRTFEGHSAKVSQVVFCDKDSSFASASWDGTVKIWNLSSDVCNTTLNGHSDRLLCVDYITGADRQHLITGSKDGTAQIWDLETKRCREYLQGHANHISAVYSHHEHQKLITGSLDGTVRIWDSVTFRLENIIALNLGAVSDVGYIEELQRIVVGCHQGIAMMMIKLS